MILQAEAGIVDLMSYDTDWTIFISLLPNDAL